ncbi:MAG: hypothetical protein A2V66_15780 [Ignavibacteria bacterium RBG_13_36_8]|nr:MAG: hypothetical protein A2V66_15780 [Ignavibacteria bacterium RBG_13_36_8]
MLSENSKLVSIIIPTYNRADIIKDTINSVLKQTYQNFEILVIDDGSTDNTKDVLNSIQDPRIFYFWQKNSGLPAKSRNLGISKARGDYIAFCDDDDIWLPQKLEKQLEAFDKYPDILAVSTNRITFPDSTDGTLKIKKDIRINLKRNLKSSMIFNSSVIIKKSVIQAIGYLDENENLKASEDWDYWIRFLHYKDKSILLLKKILLMYRIDKKSISSRNSPKYLLDIFRRKSITYKKYPKYNPKYIKKISRRDLSIAKTSIFTYFLEKNKITVNQFLKTSEILFSHKLLMLFRFFLKKISYYPFTYGKISREILELFNSFFRS